MRRPPLHSLSEWDSIISARCCTLRARYPGYTSAAANPCEGLHPLRGWLQPRGHCFHPGRGQTKFIVGPNLTHQESLPQFSSIRSPGCPALSACVVPAHKSPRHLPERFSPHRQEGLTIHAGPGKKTSARTRKKSMTSPGRKAKEHSDKDKDAYYKKLVQLNLFWSRRVGNIEIRMVE